MSRPDPAGRLGGLAGGSRPRPKGEVGGSGLGGVSRPRPKGEVGGSGWGCPGLQLGGVQAHNWGVSRSRPRGVESQHVLGQTPQQMTTAAGGTHPTGMHSC